MNLKNFKNIKNLMVDVKQYINLLYITLRQLQT